jgi:hypothetical protein
VEDQKSMLYTVRQDADNWVFVPLRIFATSMVGMFSGGSLLMLYFSTIFFRHAAATSNPTLWIGVIFVLVAGFSALMAIHSWRIRRTPLTVDAQGRVTYGKQELCPAGSVRAVQIAESRRADANEYEVGLQLAEGRLVFIPSQYFPGFADRVQARPFAENLAEALKVEVVETR